MICVVRNPNSLGILCPSVAAGGKEECGRNEDRSELHVDWKVRELCACMCGMDLEWDVGAIVLSAFECPSLEG